MKDERFSMREFFSHHTAGMAYLAGISTTALGAVHNKVEQVSSFSMPGDLSDIGVTVGILCTAGTFGLNFVFKLREDRRKQREHGLEMLRLQEELDAEQSHESKP